MRNITGPILLSLLLFYSNASNAQEKCDDSFEELVEMFKSLTIDSTRASKDIKENKFFLYLPGSIGCPPLSKYDEEVMAKYGFIYTCQGCTRVATDNVAEYNRIMISYLVEKFGTNITSEFRIDIIKTN
jgi:hypothetical protein